MFTRARVCTSPATACDAPGSQLPAAQRAGLQHAGQGGRGGGCRSNASAVYGMAITMRCSLPAFMVVNTSAAPKTRKLFSQHIVSSSTKPCAHRCTPTHYHPYLLQSHCGIAWLPNEYIHDARQRAKHGLGAGMSTCTSSQDDYHFYGSGIWCR